VELKARDPDPGRSLEVCESLGAECQDVLMQCDTYFHVPQGRLKLREEQGATSHLISYVRSDQSEPRESRYRIVEVEHPEELKAALTEVLGVKVVVEKRRQLFLWQGVRIHLDRVERLGDFIELEAVAPPGSDLAPEQRKTQQLRTAFEIADDNLIGASYSDLALAAEGAGAV
jgi:predicted adenylyl cyclase CyaB